jgi:hypothetical protein
MPNENEGLKLQLQRGSDMNFEAIMSGLPVILSIMGLCVIAWVACVIFENKRK